MSNTKKYKITCVDTFKDLTDPNRILHFHLSTEDIEKTKEEMQFQLFGSGIIVQRVEPDNEDKYVRVHYAVDCANFFCKLFFLNCLITFFINPQTFKEGVIKGLRDTSAVCLIILVYALIQAYKERKKQKL